MIPKKTNYSLHLILKNLKYLHFLQKNQIQNFIGTQSSIDPFLKSPELQSSYNLAKRLYSSNKLTGLNRNQLHLSLPLTPTNPEGLGSEAFSAKANKTINANLTQKTFFYYSPSFFQSIHPLHYFPSAQVTSSLLERNPSLELRGQGDFLRSRSVESQIRAELQQERFRKKTKNKWFDWVAKKKDIKEGLGSNQGNFSKEEFNQIFSIHNLNNFNSETIPLMKYSKLQEFKLVTIEIASAEKMKEWAEKILPNGKIFGEVTNANTLHYKTFKPHKGGLFCERIFGPLKDFECACGIYSKPSEIESKKILEHEQMKRNFCANCDVEYTWSVIRRYQLGYIQLVSAVSHIWYLKANPSYLSLLLDFKKSFLESIIYCTQSITLENLFRKSEIKSLDTSAKSLYSNWQKIIETDNTSNASMQKTKGWVARLGNAHIKRPLRAIGPMRSPSVALAQQPLGGLASEATAKGHRHNALFGRASAATQRGFSDPSTFFSKNKPTFLLSKKKYFKLQTRLKMIQIYFQNQNNSNQKFRFSNENFVCGSSIQIIKKQTKIREIWNEFFFENFNQRYIADLSLIYKNFLLKYKVHYSYYLMNNVYFICNTDQTVAAKFNNKLLNTLNNWGTQGTHNNIKGSKDLNITKQTENRVGLELNQKQAKNQTPKSTILKNRQFIHFMSFYLGLDDKLELEKIYLNKLVHFSFYSRKVKKQKQIMNRPPTLLCWALPAVTIGAASGWASVSVQPNSLVAAHDRKKVGQKDFFKFFYLKKNYSEILQIKEKFFFKKLVKNQSNFLLLNQKPLFSQEQSILSSNLGAECNHRFAFDHRSKTVQNVLNICFFVFLTSVLTPVRGKAKEPLTQQSMEIQFQKLFALHSSNLFANKFQIFEIENYFKEIFWTILMKQKNWILLYSSKLPYLNTFFYFSFFFKSKIIVSLKTSKDFFYITGSKLKKKIQKINTMLTNSLVLFNSSTVYPRKPVLNPPFHNAFSLSMETFGSKGRTPFTQSSAGPTLAQLPSALRASPAISGGLGVPKQLSELGEWRLQLQTQRDYLQFYGQSNPSYEFSPIRKVGAVRPSFRIRIRRSHQKKKFFLQKQKQIKFKKFYNKVTTSASVLRSPSVWSSDWVGPAELWVHGVPLSLAASAAGLRPDGVPQSLAASAAGLRPNGVRPLAPYGLGSSSGAKQSPIWRSSATFSSIEKFLPKSFFLKKFLTPMNTESELVFTNQLHSYKIKKPTNQITDFSTSQKFKNNLYTISYFYGWSNNTNWKSFLYYNSKSAKIEDKTINYYKNRNLSLGWVSDRRSPAPELQWHEAPVLRSLKPFTAQTNQKLGWASGALGALARSACATLSASKGHVQNMSARVHPIDQTKHLEIFTGASLIQKLLTEFDLYELKKMIKQHQILIPILNRSIRKLKKSLKKKTDFIKIQKLLQKRDHIIKRLKFLSKISSQNTNPKGSAQSMILSVLPVLPPDLRPILKLQNQIAASDLNRLYQRIIYRNERFKKFLRDPSLNSVSSIRSNKLIESTVGFNSSTALGALRALPSARKAPKTPNQRGAKGRTPCTQSSAGPSGSDWVGRMPLPLATGPGKGNPNLRLGWASGALGARSATLTQSLSGDSSSSTSGRAGQSLAASAAGLRPDGVPPLQMNSPVITAGGQLFEMRYAQRLLQESVDNLIENGKGSVKPETNSRGQPLKSLSEILKGKQGRFRQYLLGKRVDYSGRSVIVVGPKLKLSECGLPLRIAIELFLPFLIKKILHYRLARTVIGAKNFINASIHDGAKGSKHGTLETMNQNITWNLLNEIMKNHPILLNRAPTLHRLGIQAFIPKLIYGQAILLHPLVCSAFNADFDGDQMAVHVPITVEARTEAWSFLFSRNHLLSAATGEPILLPSQDMVLGCYYLTTENLAVNLKQIYSKTQFEKIKTKFVNQLTQTNGFASNASIINQLYSRPTPRGTLASVAAEPLVGGPKGRTGTSCQCTQSSAGPSRREGSDWVVHRTASSPGPVAASQPLGRMPLPLATGLGKGNPNLRLGWANALTLTQSLEVYTKLKPYCACLACRRQGTQGTEGLQRRCFSDWDSVLTAYQTNQIELQSILWLKWNGLLEQGGNEPFLPIELRIDSFGHVQKITAKMYLNSDCKGHILSQYIRTTPGRVLLNTIIKNCIRF